MSTYLSLGTGPRNWHQTGRPVIDGPSGLPWPQPASNGLGNLASALDEYVCNRAKSPIPQGHDCDRSWLHGQLNRQFGERTALADYLQVERGRTVMNCPLLTRSMRR